MSERCPTCGREVSEQPDTTVFLRARCVDNGHFICADDAVHEDVAATLIDRAEGTLSNWRANGIAAIPFYRHGKTGRVRYRLADLATFLDAQKVHD